MAVKQGLTAMDLVTRSWAKELGLDECGVMVLCLLGEQPHRAASNLALHCGRARQQVHRALVDMRRKALVRPSAVSARGRIEAWSLTDRGEQLWTCLERGLQLWDHELGEIVELPELIASLQRIAEVIVNRPGADGWGRGLLVPQDLRSMPMWADLYVNGPLYPPPAEKGRPRRRLHHGR